LEHIGTIINFHQLLDSLDDFKVGYAALHDAGQTSKTLLSPPQRDVNPQKDRTGK